MPELKPCGTYAAYVRHIRRHEDACQPCLDALGVYQATKLANETRHCSHEGCHNPMRARRMCRTHYERWLRTHSTQQVEPKARRKTAVREEYEFFRSQGCQRQEAAELAGAAIKTTYQWEPATLQQGVDA